MEQMDVETAFLNGKVKSEVYFMNHKVMKPVKIKSANY